MLSNISAASSYYHWVLNIWLEFYAILIDLNFNLNPMWLVAAIPENLNTQYLFPVVKALDFEKSHRPKWRSWITQNYNFISESQEAMNSF